MSAKLILAALACDDDISSDSEAATPNGKDEETAAEAISHTSNAGCDGATDLAISTKRLATRKKKIVRGCRWWYGGEEAQGRTYVPGSSRGRRNGAMHVRRG